jgi:hypothetical protein
MVSISFSKVLHVTPSGWAICNPPLPTLYNLGSNCTSLHCTHELDNSRTKIHYVLQLVSRSIKLFNFLALEMDMKATTNISRAHQKHILDISLSVNWATASTDLTLPWISTRRSIMSSYQLDSCRHCRHFTWQRNIRKEPILTLFLPYISKV